MAPYMHMWGQKWAREGVGVVIPVIVSVYLWAAPATSSYPGRTCNNNPETLAHPFWEKLHAAGSESGCETYIFLLVKMQLCIFTFPFLMVVTDIADSWIPEWEKIKIRTAEFQTAARKEINL